MTTKQFAHKIAIYLFSRKCLLHCSHWGLWGSTAWKEQRLTHLYSWSISSFRPLRIASRDNIPKWVHGILTAWKLTPKDKFTTKGEVGTVVLYSPTSEITHHYSLVVTGTQMSSLGNIMSTPHCEKEKCSGCCGMQSFGKLNHTGDCILY